MEKTQRAAIRLNRARSSMIVNRFADTGIIGKRRLCVNRVTDQHQIMTFNNIWFLRKCYFDSPLIIGPNLFICELHLPQMLQKIFYIIKPLFGASLDLYIDTKCKNILYLIAQILSCQSSDMLSNILCIRAEVIFDK